MNLKKKLKKFFTLNRSANDGFTLVELIVVIAILGILAGVGTVAYSGYIKKAQTAADEILLDSLNTAFAAACIENGVDVSTLANGSVTATMSNGEVTAVSQFDTEFEKYYEGGKFKVYVALNFRNGMFEGVSEGGAVKIDFGSGTYYISQATIDAFKQSVFNGKVSAMQSQVGGLANAFGDVVTTKADAELLFGDEFVKYLTDNGIADADIGNAAVLYVAQNSAGVTAQDIANKFNKAAAGNPTNMRDILEAFADDEDPLTSAALMYGAVTAFANSDACTDDAFKSQVQGVKNGNDLFTVFGTLVQDGNVQSQWNSYIGTNNGDGTTTPSDAFTKDINGFLGAMDAINTVSPDIDETDADVWESDEIKELLSSLGIS